MMQKEFKKIPQKGINTPNVIFDGAAIGKSIQIADKENADFIAMTSHCGGKLIRLFYGSVAANVINLVVYPPLVIQSGGEQKQQ